MLPYEIDTISQRCDICLYLKTKLQYDFYSIRFCGIVFDIGEKSNMRNK